jgi:hypothetical protein
MTVSLRADLSGLDAGLRRAQELISRSAQGLEQQEERFRRAGAAARDFGDGASRWLGGVASAAGEAGESAQGLERRWSVAWEAMDATADAALSRITRRFGGAVARMITYGGSFKDFWRGLWDTLLRVAINALTQIIIGSKGVKAAMQGVFDWLGKINPFGQLGAGGILAALWEPIGDIFSSIGDWLGFDNPAHDAWARKQGFDFGRHFRAGVAAAMARPFGVLPPTLSPALAGAGLGAVTAASFRAVSIQPGAFQVTVYAQELNERVVRNAGGILADEVSRRLGWTDRRSGM